jgi:hypothetical protein
MHDRNGTELKKGDTVLIEAVISDVQAHEEFCNVTLQIGKDKEHGADNIHSSVTLNTKQTLLYKKGE